MAGVAFIFVLLIGSSLSDEGIADNFYCIVNVYMLFIMILCICYLINFLFNFMFILSNVSIVVFLLLFTIAQIHEYQAKFLNILVIQKHTFHCYISCGHLVSQILLIVPFLTVWLR